MFNLEPAITEWRRQMAAGGLKSFKALEELEAHLRDDVEQGMRSGVGVEKAFGRAVQQLGSVVVLETEFAKAARRRRRMYAIRALVIGAGLFLLGVLFSQIALLPSMIFVSQKYAHWYGFQSVYWEPNEYASFVIKLTLGTGLVFMMPVVILTLVKVGVLNFRMLAKARRPVIVINLILGALITTPEIFTQVLMFVPLQILFEATVHIARRWDRRERITA